MRRTSTTMAAGLASMLAAAMPAAAGDFSLNLGIGLGGRGGHLGLSITEGCVRPAVRVQQVVPAQRVWVPPVYKVVTERVWVPTVETRYRDVPVVDACGQVIAYRREAYTVTGGYWKEVQRRVLIREGHWITKSAPVRVKHGVTAGSIFLGRPRAVTGRIARPRSQATVRAACIRRR